MKTFKQAFCEFYGCSPEDYPREAFFRTLHTRARALGRVLWWMEPRECLELLEEAGLARSEEELLDVIEQSKHDAHERGKTFRQRHNLRVSGKRLLVQYRRVMSAARHSESGGRETFN